MDSSSVVRVLWTDSAARPVADDLIRREAAQLLSCGSGSVRVGRLCPACGSSGHGQPFVRADTRELCVSVGRSDEVTVVALTRAGAVGVDVEPEGGASFEGFADVALHVRERAGTDHERTLTWVRKEAVLKAAGVGLIADPSMLRLTDPADAPGLLQWPGHERLAARVQLHDVDTIPGHLAAVAVLADAAPALVISEAGRAVPSPRARR